MLYHIGDSLVSSGFKNHTPMRVKQQDPFRKISQILFGGYLIPMGRSGLDSSAYSGISEKRRLPVQVTTCADC